MRILWGKIGEEVVRSWPLTHLFVVWAFLRLCQFWWKSIKKCDRESARRRTDTLTDWQTQIDFIICPMLYAIAMRQIKRPSINGADSTYSANSHCNTPIQQADSNADRGQSADSADAVFKVTPAGRVWRMRRHGPVIAQCTDCVVFPISECSVIRQQTLKRVVTKKGQL